MPGEIAEELQQAAEAADLSRPAKEVDEVVEVPAEERAVEPTERPVKKVGEVEITREKPDGQVGAGGEIKYSAAKLGVPEGEEVVISKEQRDKLEQKLEVFYNLVEQYQDFARRGGVALPKELEEFCHLYKGLGKENFLLYSKNFAMAESLMGRMELINIMGTAQYISTTVSGLENIPPEEREKIFTERIKEGKLHELVRLYEDKIKKIVGGVGLFVEAPLVGIGVGAVAGSGVGTGVGAIVGAGPGLGYGLYRLYKSATTNNYTEVKLAVEQFSSDMTQFLGNMPEWKGIIDYFDSKISPDAKVKTMLDMAEMKMNLDEALGVSKDRQGSTSWWEAAFVPENIEKVDWLLGRDRVDNLRRLTPAGQEFETWWLGLNESQRMEHLFKADTETFKSLLGSQVVEIIREGPLPGVSSSLEAARDKEVALKMTPEEWAVEVQGKKATVEALKKLADEELPAAIKARTQQRDEMEVKAEGFERQKVGLIDRKTATRDRIDGDDGLISQKEAFDERIKETTETFDGQIKKMTTKINKLERKGKKQSLNDVEIKELAGLGAERDDLEREKQKQLNGLTTEKSKVDAKIQALEDKIDDIEKAIIDGEVVVGQLGAYKKQVEDLESQRMTARSEIVRLEKEIKEGAPKVAERQTVLLTCCRRPLEKMDSWLGKATTRAAQERLTVEYLTSTESRPVKIKNPDGEAETISMFGGYQDILKLIFSPANEHEWGAAYEILDPDALLKIYKNRFSTPDGMNFEQALGYIRQNVSENQFKMAYVDIIWHIRNKLESISGLIVPEAEEQAVAA